MSGMIMRTALLASLAVSLILIGVVAAESPQWKGDSQVSFSGNLMLAQAASSPDPAGDAEAQAKKSETEQKSDKDIPPPGLCRSNWIHGWDVRTYRCDVLFGPA